MNAIGNREGPPAITQIRPLAAYLGQLSYLRDTRCTTRCCSPHNNCLRACILSCPMRLLACIRRRTRTACARAHVRGRAYAHPKRRTRAHETPKKDHAPAHTHAAGGRREITGLAEQSAAEARSNGVARARVRAVWGGVSAPAIPHRESKRTVRQGKGQTRRTRTLSRA